MKASDLLLQALPTLPQRLCRDFEAIRYVKSKVLFDAMIAAGWLKPCFPSRHRLMLFDYRDLDLCIERLKEEGFPSSISESEASKCA